MKHKLCFPEILFCKTGILNLANLIRSPGLLTIAFLFCTVNTFAQEMPASDEFIIGAYFSAIDDRWVEQIYYDTFAISGMNTLFQYALNGVNGNQSSMQNYNLVANNHEFSTDLIGYYSTCYYTRWEAEENQPYLDRVGVKHADGEKVYWDSAWCWSTENVSTQVPSLIYGPNYRQDNRYKDWSHGDRNDVRYYVRYRMALDKTGSINPNEPVCDIKVVYNYRKFDAENEWGDSTIIFLEKTLTVGDFPDNGELDYFYFDGDQYYKYPKRFWLPKNAGKMDPSIEQDYPIYEDSRPYQGIQFQVDWRIGYPVEPGVELNLYVDHIEVYDKDWKEGFIEDPDNTMLSIQGYALDYSVWNNVKYWNGQDEPYSIDAFTPTRIIDSLLYNNPDNLYKHRLLTIFNPYWTWDNKINGDTLLFQYYRMANPEQLLVDIYPFSSSFPEVRFEDFDYLRYTFQECHTLQPVFGYIDQSFGKKIVSSGQWWTWRYPTNEEFNASMMLALAHGSKGLFFWIYDSYTYWSYEEPSVLHKIIGLRDEDNNITATPLWYHIKDDLVPRLKSKLGKTLMNLDYTGDYVQRYYSIPTENPFPDAQSFDYLTLGYPPH